MRLAILILIILFSTSCFAKNSELAIDQKEITRFIEIIKKIKKNYVYELNDEKIFNDAIKGVLTKLDPHSTYYAKSEYFDILNKTNGEYAGIGVEVSIIDGNLQITRVLENSPAYEAGLKDGDIIKELNEKTIDKVDIEEVKNIIYGEVGTTLQAKLDRQGKEFVVNLTRKNLKIDSVDGKILDQNVLYIKISYFSESTYSDAIDLIKKNNKVDGIILDLRDNGGGLLEQSIKIADAFLEKGEIVSIRYKEKDDIKKYNASGNNIAPIDKPMIVLINNYSASAAEILTGALKDNNRAIIVGEKSFGKGSVQNIIPLKDNDAIKITTALFYTPSGLMIQNNGIIPDIEIENGVLSKKNSNEIKSENELESGHGSNFNDENIKKDIEDLQLYIANQIINFKIKEIERKK